MNTFRVIDTYTNTVVDEFILDRMLRSDAYSDTERFDVIDITALTEAQQNGVYHGRRRISKLEFMRLLTAAERKAIRGAGKANADLEDFLDLLDKADTVSLDSADTITGLTVLESAGLLAQGRAAEILNG